MTNIRKSKIERREWGEHCAGKARLCSNFKDVGLYEKAIVEFSCQTHPPFRRIPSLADIENYIETVSPKRLQYHTTNIHSWVHGDDNNNNKRPAPSWERAHKCTIYYAIGSYKANTLKGITKQKIF